MTLKEFVAGVKEWCRKYLQKGADTLFLPLQVLQEYVRLVEDVETRLNLATKYKCHDVVIDVSPCCVCAERGQEPAFSLQLSHAICCCVPGGVCLFLSLGKTSNCGSVPFAQMCAGFAVCLDVQGSEGSHPADGI